MAEGIETMSVEELRDTLRRSFGLGSIELGVFDTMADELYARNMGALRVARPEEKWMFCIGCNSAAHLNIIPKLGGGCEKFRTAELILRTKRRNINSLPCTIHSKYHFDCLTQAGYTFY